MAHRFGLLIILYRLTMNFITLNDGNKIPAIGFGTFQIPPDGSTYEAVKTALSLGIRLSLIHI